MRDPDFAVTVTLARSVSPTCRACRCVFRHQQLAMSEASDVAVICYAIVV